VNEGMGDKLALLGVSIWANAAVNTPNASQSEMDPFFAR